MAAKMVDYLTAFSSNPEENELDYLRGQGVVKEFETKIATVVGKKYCLSTNNATNALLVLGLATGLRYKEIITTPRTFGATYGPFLLLQNRFHFGRVDRNGNLTPESVEDLAQQTHATAVVTVDFQGRPHNSAEMREVCHRHNLLYIADAAQSFGQRLPNGRHASVFADALVLSFGPCKPVSCGEGGAILTDDETIYQECIRLSQHPERYKYECSLLGATDIQPINGRMHPLAAIMGLVQLSNSGLTL